MPVKDTDRAEFEAFHDLGFDSDGREVLVGLSYEETEWYLDVLERDRAGKGLVTRDEVLRRAHLDDRHNVARLHILEAWDEARFNARWGRKWFKNGAETRTCMRASSRWRKNPAAGTMPYSLPA